MFFEAYPTARSANMHIAKTTQCRLAGMGVKTVVVETRATDTMVGGSGAAGPVPDLRHQPPGYFSVKKSRSRYKHGISMLVKINSGISQVYTLVEGIAQVYTLVENIGHRYT